MLGMNERRRYQRAPVTKHKTFYADRLVPCWAGMNEPDPLPPGRKYIWPWFAAAAVVLGIVLAVFWVWLEVRHVEMERDVNGPLPSQH